jgi:hypothetical protein
MRMIKFFENTKKLVNRPWRIADVIMIFLAYILEKIIGLIKHPITLPAI